MRRLIPVLVLAACSHATSGMPDAGVDAAANLDAAAEVDAAGADANQVSCSTVAHLGNPQVKSLGGHVLGSSSSSPLHLITIVPPGFTAMQATNLHGFGDFLVGSPALFLDPTAKEYGYDSSASVHLAVAGPALPAPGCGALVCKNQIPAYLDNVIAANPSAGIGHRDDNLYVLYLPMGTGVQGPAGGSNSFHAALGTTTVEGYALIQNDQPYSKDSYSTAASHEVVEAITNSDMDNGWVLRQDASTALASQSSWVAMQSNLHDELADLCEGTFARIGGWQVTRSFSNAAALAGPDPCVPAAADAYFNTSTAQPSGGGAWSGWTPVTVPGANTCASGGSGSTANLPIQIAVHGWSGHDAINQCAPEPWKIAALPVTTSGSGTFDTSAVMPTLSSSTMTNGGMALLTVTIPAGACSGWWGSVIVESRPMKILADHDLFHREVFPIWIN